MVRALRPAVALAPLLLVLAVPAAAQTPVSYQLSFPERAQRIMHVAITFPDLPDGTLELRMSRSSPGRYAAHDFAKNVFDLRATDGRGRPLHPTRPNPHQWNVADHDGTVHVTYQIFGDRLDGTYLAIDSTHAHINMPAALLWARGLDLRPVEVRFERPEGTTWRVATQLYPSADPLTFTAPNLQYLMDSPAEFSEFTERTFTIEQDGMVQTIRVAMHHEGSDRDLDGFVGDLEAIVREARHVFGEYPAFETGTYTFIANYLPSATGDGMEHRNSTVLTSPSSIRADRLGLLNTAAHEFVHVWNVERIRPRSLEPFDFEDANIASELWFAEGFTSYYAILLLQRAGLTRMADFAQEMTRLVEHRAPQPRPAAPHARADEPHGTIRRRGGGHRPDELREHLSLLLHVGRRDGPRARPHAARPQRRHGHPGRLHAGALAAPRPAGRIAPGLRRPTLHDGRSADRARRCVG
jgi:predicted metalloprotease with PDZ domain